MILRDENNVVIYYTCTIFRIRSLNSFAREKRVWLIQANSSADGLICLFKRYCVYRSSISPRTAPKKKSNSFSTVLFRS